MIEYRDNATGIQPSDLDGFFEAWANPPSPAKHLELLQNSSHVLIAQDSDSKAVAGFITAISDGVLSAYIPLLEVLPGYRGKGIGTELITRMHARLNHLYMVDLVCDEDVRPFYERLGLLPRLAMVRRNTPE